MDTESLNISRLKTLSEHQKRELIIRLRNLVAETGKGGTETQLTAFVKCRGTTTTPSNEEVFLHLNKLLPEFMVPSQITVVDSWPKTANGKIDRKALAKQATIQNSDIHYDEVIEAQSSENEYTRKLLQIWRDTLGNPKIGMQDNFFQIGGDSILAIQIISKANQAGISLTVNQLFNAPTIQSLAEILEDHDSEKQTVSTLVFLKPGDGNPSRKTLYVAHGIGGEVFELTDLIQHFDASQKIVGIHSVKHSGENERQSSVGAMAKRYADDILAHQPEGPYYLMGCSTGGLFAFETARQLQKQGKQIGQLFILDTMTSNVPVHILYCAQFSKRQLSRLLSRDRLRHYVQKSFKSNLKDIYFRLINLIPGFLRRQQSKVSEEQTKILPDVDYYQKITSLYVPIPSEMPVTVLRSNLNKYDAHVIWKYLSKGQVYIIPVDITHLEIREDRRVAGKLQERLNAL